MNMCIMQFKLIVVYMVLSLFLLWVKDGYIMLYFVYFYVPDILKVVFVWDFVLEIILVSLIGMKCIHEKM